MLVMSLGALTGWYLFLRGERQTTTAIDVARGFGTAVPSFSGALGSAYQNVVSSLLGDASPASSTPAALWQISKTPVGGAGFVRNENGLRLYFIERSTGYLFSADPVTGAIVRLSNTLMPKAYEATIGRNGTVIARSLDSNGNITTFSGSLSASSSADSLRELVGVKLPNNIDSLALSPSGGEVFYLINDSGATVGMRAYTDGTKPKRLFASAIASWHTRWLSDGRLILTESPSDSAPGYAYRVATGTREKLLGALPGLLVLPRASSSALLYSTADRGGLSLFARASASSSVAELPVRTIADKCVWLPSKELIAYCAVPQDAPAYPFLDTWYRGEVHTADAWWRIEISTGNARIAHAPEQGLALDVEDPQVDDAGSYLYFVNKADKSLWLLRLTP